MLVIGTGVINLAVMKTAVIITVVITSVLNYPLLKFSNVIKGSAFIIITTPLDTLLRQHHIGDENDV